MCRAVITAAKAGGKPVNSSTTTRISQTWFASQIGPMACGDELALPLGARAAREQVPDAAAEVGAAEQRVEVSDDEHRRPPRRSREAASALLLPAARRGSRRCGLSITCQQQQPDDDHAPGRCRAG